MNQNELKLANEQLNDAMKDLLVLLEAKNVEIKHLQAHLDIQAGVILELREQLKNASEFKL